MDRQMTGCVVEAIPTRAAAGVGAASLAVLLALLPSLEPVVRLVAPAAVVATLGTVMAPSPRG